MIEITRENRMDDASDEMYIERSVDELTLVRRATTQRANPG